MANDNPKVSTASDQTAQLQGSLVALDRNALMKGDQAIAREKLKLGQKQLEAQIEATKLEAQTTMQREQMVQEGWDKQRAFQGEQADKSRAFEAEQSQAQFKQRQELEAQAATRAFDTWKKQQQITRQAEREKQITEKEAERRRLESDRELARSQIARARVAAELEGHTEEGLRALKALRKGFVEQAQEAAVIGQVMTDVKEQLASAYESAFEADADLSYRTSPAQGNIMPVQRVTASGNVRGDLVDFANQSGAVDARGRIRFSSLAEAEQVLSAWSTQSSEGTINPARATGENKRRQDAARDARGEEAGNWLTAQGPVTLIGQWVRGRSSQGQALDPTEVLHVQAARATLAMRDALTSLGDDLGHPDLADRFHQAFTTLGEAALEGDIADAEQLVGEIIPPGTEPMFREFMNVNFDALRGGLDMLRKRDDATPGRDSAEKDAIRKQVLDALNGYKDTVGEITRALPELGISSVKERIEPVKAMLEDAIDAQDVKALESLSPDDIEFLSALDPEIKGLLEDYTKAILGVDSTRDALRALSEEELLLVPDLAERNLEGDLGDMRSFSQREQEIYR